MPELEVGFYQQKLFDQSFACVVRRDHPRIAQRLTENLFRREKHVVITAPGTGHDLVELGLSRQRFERKVALSLPTLPGVGNLLANTDLIATVPERIAQMLVRIARVKALPPPFTFPAFSIKQHWHERYHQDPANRWCGRPWPTSFLKLDWRRERDARARGLTNRIQVDTFFECTRSG